MNKILPIIILSLLFTTGCENFFGMQDDNGDPYANYMLLYNLEQDLALSEKQISDSRNFLRSGRDYFPDNTSLWKLASYLQENLTEEQKERLLSHPEYLQAEEISEENDDHHKRLRHHHRMDEFIQSILNADQLSDYENICFLFCGKNVERNLRFNEVYKKYASRFIFIDSVEDVYELHQILSCFILNVLL